MKVYNWISEETGTTEVHQGQSATPNTMTELVYDNKLTPWPLHIIFIAGNSTINETDEKRLSKKTQMRKSDISTQH